MNICIVYILFIDVINNKIKDNKQIYKFFFFFKVYYENGNLFLNVAMHLSKKIFLYGICRYKIFPKSRSLLLIILKYL